MSIFKEEYDSIEKKKAEFVAYLRDCAIYESNGKIYFVNKENLNDSITKLILENKFTEVNNLVKSAKTLNNNDLVTAETSLKSFRMLFDNYSKLSIISSINSESLSDSTKRVILPKLNSSLDEIGKNVGVSINKLNQIKGLLKDWSERKAEIREKNYYVDISESRSKIEGLAQKYLSRILMSVASDLNFDTSVMNMFIEDISDPIFVKKVGFDLIPESGNLICTLSVTFSEDITESDYDVTDKFIETVKKSFGIAKADDFLNIYDSLCEFDIITLGKYQLSFGDGKLLVNGIEMRNKELVKKIIFNELANKYPVNYPLNTCFNISDIPLLPKDFNVDTYVKKVQDAILINDYDEASELSEALETYEIISDLSDRIYYILTGLIKESRVITIAIPNAILYLLDLIKGKKSYKEFVTEATDDYWYTQQK